MKNTTLMQTGVRFCRPALKKLASSQQGRKQMTSSQSTCTRDYFGFPIFCSFVVMIRDSANQHKRDTFRRDARWRALVTQLVQLFILFMNTDGFESTWPGDVNSRNSYISLTVFWLHLLISSSGKTSGESIEKYSEAKIYRTKPEPRNCSVILFLQVNIWKIIYLNCGERYEDMTDHRRVIYTT